MIRALLGVVGVLGAAACSGVDYDATGSHGAVDASAAAPRGAVLVYADESRDVATLRVGVTMFQDHAPVPVSVTGDRAAYDAAETPERWEVVRLPIGAAGCDEGALCLPPGDDPNEVLFGCISPREKLILIGECAGPGTAVLRHELGHVLGVPHSLDGGLMSVRPTDYTRLSASTVAKLRELYR